MSSREPSSSPEAPPQTQFVSLSDDDDNLWEVEEILDERGPVRDGEYLVLWKGIDPATNRPWEATWTAKSGCTQGLIDEWKARKKANPGIVGIAAKKLQEELDAKKRKKRKRADRSSSKAQGKKRKVVAESRARSRAARSKDTSSSVSRSPERPATTKSDAPSTSKTRRNQRAAPRNQYSRDSASASVEPSESPSEVASPKRVLRSDGHSEVTSPQRSLRSGRVLEVEEHGSSSPNQPTAGPGPSTIANRDRRNSPIRSRAQDAAKMPPPRSSPRQSANEPVETQTTRSGVDSQADPIDRFSSPLSRRAKRGKQTTFKVPEPKGVDSVNDDVEPVHPTETLRGDEADDSGTTQKGKLVKRIVDGEEVSERVSESEEDDEDDAAAPEADVQEQEAEHGDGYVTAPVPAEEINDADLDGLSTGDVDEGGFEEQIAEAPAGNLCLWKGCPESFESPRDLALHIISHAAESDPDHESAPEIGSSHTPVPVLPFHDNSAPHPDTEELARTKVEFAAVQAEIVKLQTEITRVQAELVEARTTPAAVETTSDEVQQIRAQVHQLEVEAQQFARSRETLLSDNDFLRTQYNNASEKAVQEVNRSRELTARVKTLKEQLDFGLKQRKIINEEAAKKREDEIRQLKGQVKILLDQSRRTDDTVRRKATFYDRYKAEYDQLVATLSEQTTKIEKLELRNEELCDQIATLRAAQMGVLGEDGDEETDDDDAGEDESYRDGPSHRHSSPLGNMTMDEMPSAIRRYTNHSTPAKRMTSNHLGGNSTIVNDEGPNTREGGKGYICKWRNGEDGCAVVCDTVEDLHEHALNHQRTELSAGDLL
ncbi:hypothetical protein CI109_101896 [Kwoniella shandongensis]|uniref:Uncharacterized protein n=1 Tax=Kwoniella shandongensis TaxID=1734106 RepID=A0A5M6BQ78_9TREE|nr:uncharacterized protein CI109_006768 [Kwoniella shandongensis]KAA5524897.1 hypothetical protein CI109_006768 [Kwoniella shandongensis]